MKPKKSRLASAAVRVTKIIFAAAMVYIFACSLRAAITLHRRYQEAPLSTLETNLFRWVEERGGKIHIRMGAPCPTCPRGAIATRSIPAGGLIISLPQEAMIKLPELDHMGFPAVSCAQTTKIATNIAQAFKTCFSACCRQCSSIYT